MKELLKDVLYFLLLALLLFFIFDTWKAERGVNKELKEIRARIDSLEILIAEKESRIDTLITKLDSLKSEKPQFKPKYYETMTMPEFIEYLNERYPGY